MHELVGGRLWIGNAGDLRDDPKRWLMVGIGAVVDLAMEELPAEPPRGVRYLRIPIIDGPDNEPNDLRLAIGAVGLLLRASTPTLVCCSAGMSRAPTVTTLALAIDRQEAPAATLATLFAGRPHDISPALWNSAIDACGDQLPRG